MADEPQVTQTPGKKRKGPDAMQGRGVPASEEGGLFFLFVCFFNICFYKLAKERVGLWHVEETGFLRLQKE